MVTGAGAVDSDLGWLSSNARAEDEPVEIRDVTDELAVIGLWGPHARSVLAAVTEDDVSADALPFRRAKEIAVGGRRCWRSGSRTSASSASSSTSSASGPCRSGTG